MGLPRPLQEGEGGGLDPGGDLGDGGGGVDHGEALGIGGGQVAEGLADALVEAEVLGLDPVQLAAAAAQAGRRVEVEQHDQVGQQPAGGEPVDLLDRAPAQPAAGALVGQGRVQVAVAEHHRAPLQGGADHRFDELGPGGREQQRLGPRVELRLRVEQHRPDPLPRRGATGLAGHDHLAAPALQDPAEQLQLGGLAGPLDPLEGDQAARVTHRTPRVRR